MTLLEIILIHVLSVSVVVTASIAATLYILRKYRWSAF